MQQGLRRRAHDARLRLGVLVVRGAERAVAAPALRRSAGVASGAAGVVEVAAPRRRRVASSTIATTTAAVTSPTSSHGSSTPTATPSQLAKATSAFQPATSPLQKSSGCGSGADVLGDEVDRDGREVDLVDEPVALLREAVELRLAGRELRLDRDEVGDRGRLGEQLLQPVDRGGERLDARVEVLSLLRDIRGVHRHRVHRAERAQLVDERVELVGRDAQGERSRSPAARRCPGVSVRLSTRPPACSARSAASSAEAIGSSTVIETQPGRDDAAVGELRLGGAAAASSAVLPSTSCRARGATARTGASTAGALDSDRARRAAGEEQCGDRGRCRRGCESSHALTVLRRANPMSGRRLGVGSRSDSASL